MFGHDHVPERISIQSRSGGTLDVLKGGEMTLSLEADASFNTVSFDSDNKTISTYEYKWNKNERIFTSSIIDIKEVTRAELAPKMEYIDYLLEDSQQLSGRISDYYVFPKLVQRDSGFSDEVQIISDETAFYSFLEQNRHVGITGSNNCGKSALIKILYSKSIENGFLPLFIEKRDYDSRIEKMLRDLFQEQYGDVPLGFERYMQETGKTRIFFIDDFDLIQSEKARTKLVSYILDHNGVLVYSTKSWTQNDLTDVVKEKIQEKNSCVFEILPFYKEKRDILANNILQLCGKTHAGSTDVIISALDYLAQCQASLPRLAIFALEIMA